MSRHSLPASLSRFASFALLALLASGSGEAASEVRDDAIKLELSPRVCTLSADAENCDTVVTAQWHSPRDESLCLLIVGQPQIKQCWESHSEGVYSVRLVFNQDLVVELRDPKLQNVLTSEAIAVIKEALRLRRKRRQPWISCPDVCGSASCLLVEDDLRLSELVRSYLQSNGFQVLVEYRGEGVLDRRDQRSTRTCWFWISACPGAMASWCARSCAPSAVCPSSFSRRATAISTTCSGLELGADDFRHQARRAARAGRAPSRLLRTSRKHQHRREPETDLRCSDDRHGGTLRGAGWSAHRAVEQ